MAKKENCPFCPTQLDVQEIVLENEHCLFLQSPMLSIEGSGMIIPRHHRERVFDLTATEWAATFTLLQEVRQLLDDTMRPDGYNVGWNCGSVGGQSVFHAHLHVIPRFVDEPLAGKGIRHWFKQESNRRPR